MKIRILTEQDVHSSQPERQYLASGSEVELPNDWARELLNRGEAEPVVEKASDSAEKRPASSDAETR